MKIFLIIFRFSRTGTEIDARYYPRHLFPSNFVLDGEIWYKNHALGQYYYLYQLGMGEACLQVYLKTLEREKLNQIQVVLLLLILLLLFPERHLMKKD